MTLEPSTPVIMSKPTPQKRGANRKKLSSFLVGAKRRGNLNARRRGTIKCRGRFPNLPPPQGELFFWTRINTDFHGFFLSRLFYRDYVIATNLSVLFRVHPCTKLKLLVNNYSKFTDWSTISNLIGGLLERLLVEQVSIPAAHR